MVIRTLSICSGIGGLDLGIKLADPRIKTVCYVEREAYCAATLVARMEDKVLDQAPIWDDLKSFPIHAFRGAVDLIYGGIPCQPYSAGGGKGGESDPRDLVDVLIELVKESTAQAVFLENVPRILRHEDGARRLLEAFDFLGFDAEWLRVSCGALGAPHIRERLFLLAYTNGAKLWLQPGRGFGEGWAQEEKLLGSGQGFWLQPPGSGRIVHGNAGRHIDSRTITEASRRAVGNAVSPPVAAVAWTELVRRATA